MARKSSGTRFRNARGRFVSKDYTGEKYLASGGHLVKYAMTKEERDAIYRAYYSEIAQKRAEELFEQKRQERIQYRAQRAEDFRQVIERYEKQGEEPPEFVTQLYKEYSADEAPMTREPKYSNKLENLGVSKEEQKEIVALFEAANVALERIKEYTDDTVGKYFSLNLQNITSLEQLQRRLEAAVKVQSPDFLSDLGAKYKEDFLTNFNGIIEKRLYNQLEELVNELGNVQFLAFLKRQNQDYLAYALQSLINEDKMDYIIREVEGLIDAAKSEKELTEELAKRGVK